MYRYGAVFLTHRVDHKLGKLGIALLELPSPFGCRVCICFSIENKHMSANAQSGGCLPLVYFMYKSLGYGTLPRDQYDVVLSFYFFEKTTLGSICFSCLLLSTGNGSGHSTSYTVM